MSIELDVVIMTSPPPTELPIEVKRVPDLRITFATGIVGGLDPRQGTIQFYIHQQNVEAVKEKPIQLRTTSHIIEIVADIRMSPATFKGVMLWMQRNIEAYEQAYGKIISDPISEQREPLSKNSERRYA